MKALVRKTRDYLEKNCKKLDLHCISRFPDGSCETSSLLLSKVLIEEFPEKKVLFVKGTDTIKYEMHFWVEVEDYIFDITADQFAGIKEPLWGKSSNRISERFDEVEKIGISEALKTNRFATTRREQLNKAASEIRAKTF